MFAHGLDRWTHRHDFLPDVTAAERGTRWVMLLTASTMGVEIVAGTVLGSMALLADGWHMATHVAAFAIAIFSYRYARSSARDPRFTFGAGKVTVLGGFASAVALACVAIFMSIESVARLITPQEIRFDEATWVAVIGLAVNVLSGVILHRAGHDAHLHADAAAHGHGHAHDHEHEHEHEHEHDHEHDHEPTHDHNLRAAYLHVVADALTSVLAIAALLGGKYFGLAWLDAAMGLVGAALIARWALGLARDSAAILLDRNDDAGIATAIRALIEAEPDHAVADLHVWQVAPGRVAAMVAIVSHAPQRTEYYRERLAALRQVDHLVIEINTCRDGDCGNGRQ